MDFQSLFEDMIADQKADAEKNSAVHDTELRFEITAISGNQLRVTADGATDLSGPSTM